MKQRRRDGERGDAEKERNVEGVGRRRRFGLRAEWPGKKGT